MRGLPPPAPGGAKAVGLQVFLKKPKSKLLLLARSINKKNLLPKFTPRYLSRKRLFTIIFAWEKPDNIPDVFEAGEKTGIERLDRFVQLFFY